MLNELAPLVIAIQAAADRAAGTSWETTMAAVKILVTVGALAGLSSVMVVMMLAQPRIFLSMSKDGLLPAWAGKIHPRFHTPHVSTLVTGAVAAVAAGLTPIGTLGNLVSIGTLLAFVIVSIGIIVLRRTQPDLPRPFRMPMAPLLPLLSALVSLLLMMSLAGRRGAADPLDGARSDTSSTATATAAFVLRVPDPTAPDGARRGGGSLSASARTTSARSR